jgi:hypothetical protein
MWHVWGEKRNAQSVLVGKPERKRPLERFRNRGKDKINIYPKEVGWEGVGWINLARDRHKWQAFVKMVKTLRAHRHVNLF